MSFGLSIGDFLAVIKLASKIRKDFTGAPDQYQQICNELRNLEYTTRDIEVLLSGKTLCKADEDRLHHITKNCRLILDDAEKIINKYSSLKLRGHGLKDKATRVWHRLQWDSDSTRDLRERITSSVTSFNSFNGLLTRDVVSKFAESHEHQEQKRDQQEILDWLTLIDYSAQQSDFISRRQAGTGQWLLDSTEYQHWLATKETLFCPGIPGAGKTILASIVVDNLLSLHGDDQSVGICVIFLNFRRNDEQKLDHLLASLLKQLACTLPVVPGPVELLYRKHKGRQAGPTTEELCKALYSVAAEFSRVFMVIDALDECQTQDNCRSRFISELLNICTKHDVNILATARPIPEITSRFEDSVVKPIRAVDDDIIKYLDGNLSCIGGPVSRDTTLQAEVKEGIVQCVDGMFLLAKLHLDSLRGKRSPKAVRCALGKLAKGGDAYDTAYHDAMIRITGQLQEQAELGLQTLMWIAFAERPLKVIELRHALGVELGATEFDDDNLPDLEDILSVCCGLVTVNEESNIIRLVHYTTQQYFERTGASWFPSAQSQIAQTCVTYLLYDTFESGSCLVYSDFEQRLYTYPLYDYASNYWGRHALLSLDYQFCSKFLTIEPKVRACGQALFAD
ncbi:hypothetical protein NUW58_g5891 [Xylaria curta]|uniref:Uncharacterized protein n=1 Tax=Xylaria curta TaxID=42375 RepID=A0ACC1P125_9PEZI|nr:hypothetical protein NUW58_g5891 [Xylaria curta]